MSCLERPEICAPETYQELVQTPKVHARLVSLGLKKKPIPGRAGGGRLTHGF